MSKTCKITGADAIRLAERENLTVHCYANPIDDGGPVTLEEARQIATDDPSMSESEARAYVAEHSDDDEHDEATLERVFAALAGRNADDADRQEGLWSHCVQLA